MTKTSRQEEMLVLARPAPNAVAVTMYRTLPCLERSNGGDDAGMIKANSNLRGCQCEQMVRESDEFPLALTHAHPL